MLPVDCLRRSIILVPDTILIAARVAAAGRPGRREGDDLALLAGADRDEAVARGVGARQLQSIEACWGHVCRLLGADTDPAAITYDVVVRYISARRGEGARGQSIAKETQALKRGLRIARRRGSLASMPEEWPVVRRDPPDQRQKGSLHPVGVIAAWLAQLADESDEAARQAEVAVRTGLRAEELRKLSFEWVEPAPEGSGVPAVLRIPAVAAKTRRERVIGLTAEALGCIDAARSAQGAWDTPLFAGNHRKAFDAARKTIGYRKTITLRDLRHCHATWAAQGTGDAAAAQAALGHTDLRTTQRYLSSTIARTASAAVAVGTTLGGPRGRSRGPNCHAGLSRSPTGTAKDEDPAGTKAPAGSTFSTSRGERTRTSGLLLPKQSRRTERTPKPLFHLPFGMPPGTRSVPRIGGRWSQ